MGIHEGPRIFRKGAETEVANAQERGMNLSDFVEKSRVQAERFALQNENKNTVFIGTGLRQQIVEAKDPYLSAKYIARTEPQFVPDTIEDVDHQAAFLIAYAEELTKPKYNQ